MHYDSASKKLWSLFADANFAQTVIVSDPDGSPSTVYTTGTISGSIEDWEGIATRSFRRVDHVSEACSFTAEAQSALR